MTQQGTGFSMHSADFDAIVVGAGFGGMYMTHKLRDDLGMKVQSYDKGGDIGGTWYANRYPGILSDTESFFIVILLIKNCYKSGLGKIVM